MSIHVKCFEQALYRVARQYISLFAIVSVIIAVTTMYEPFPQKNTPRVEFSNSLLGTVERSQVVSVVSGRI